MVAPAAAPAGKTPPPPALDAGGNALVKLATDLGTFYTTTTTKPVDVATAVKSPDTITAIEAEVARLIKECSYCGPAPVPLRSVVFTAT